MNLVQTAFYKPRHARRVDAKSFYLRSGTVITVLLSAVFVLTGCGSPRDEDAYLKSVHQLMAEDGYRVGEQADEDIISIGNDICDAWDTDVSPDVMVTLIDFPTEDSKDISVTVNTLVSAGFELCPEHKDKIDPTVDAIAEGMGR